MTFSDITRQIVESSVSGHLSLWVGSGISHSDPSRLPLADELKFEILERVCPDSDLRGRLRKQGDLQRKIRAYPLEATVQLISNHRDVLETIAEVFRGGSPNKDHFLIARLMKRGFVKEVLTTNFDLLIERALEGDWQKGVDFDVFSNEDQFKTLLFPPSHPTVFKIHGSADELSSMRVTLDLVASKRLSEPRAKLLQSFLNSREGDILVLGYGARDDFDINPIVSGIASSKRIFYVDHMPNDREISRGLPESFHNFKGVTIRCDTDEIIDSMWKNLKEDPRLPGGSAMKDWRIVLKDWADHIPISSRFFISALILHAVQEFDDASKMYAQAKEHFAREGNTVGLAASLHQLAIIAQHDGKTPEAEKLYKESMEINERSGDRLGMALGLHQLGLIAQHKGASEAELLYKRSLEIKKSLGARGEPYLASTLYQLAVIASFRPNYQEAVRLCNESLELRQRFGDELGIATCYDLLGNIALLRGEEALSEAQALYERSIEIKKKLGDEKGVASGLHQLGVIALHRGDSVEAERLTNQSLMIRQKIGDAEGVGLSKAQLGRLFESTGRLGEAEAQVSEALEIFTRIGNVPMREKASRHLDRIRAKLKRDVAP